MKAGQGFDWRTLLGGLAASLPALTAASTARRAQGDLDAGLGQIGAAQADADAMIGDEISRISASTPDRERVQSLSDYTVALRRARQEPTASVPSNLGGQKYQADKAAATNQVNTGARHTADLMSRIDAPTRQREREGQSAARTASNLVPVSAQAGSAAYLSRLQASRRRPNPWASLLAQLGTNIAQNYEPTARGAGGGIDASMVRDLPSPHARNA